MHEILPITTSEGIVMIAFEEFYSIWCWTNAIEYVVIYEFCFEDLLKVPVRAEGVDMVTVSDTSPRVSISSSALLNV